jgi:hemoglobin-like flavoprotein
VQLRRDHAAPRRAQVLSPAAISESFELAAERHGDITREVYAQLYARYPEMEALFIRDTTWAARGEMLSRTIELIFDLLDKDSYASNFVRAEIVTHDGYGVPPDVFPRFFETLAATLKELLGPDWTATMDDSWRELVTQLANTAAEGNA